VKEVNYLAIAITNQSKDRNFGSISILQLSILELSKTPSPEFAQKNQLSINLLLKLEYSVISSSSVHHLLLLVYWSLNSEVDRRGEDKGVLLFKTDNNKTLQLTT